MNTPINITITDCSLYVCHSDKTICPYCRECAQIRLEDFCHYTMYSYMADNSSSVTFAFIMAFWGMYLHTISVCPVDVNQQYFSSYHFSRVMEKTTCYIEFKMES